mmetsp:Transcript_89993/g.226366  ORF Transcript_89993/g.226366 Transcript_89993/m.226366 type:complete len:436 (+) Transcript_89993:144-1451(+)
MGGLISAPLGAVGSCLGTVFGNCLAAGCCALAGSGNFDSAYAARCAMLWLQAFAALLAWLASATSEKWVPSMCDMLGKIDIDDVGVCECSSAACRSEQLIYRAEASVVVVFAGLFLMAISGCAQGAARSHAVAKFMLVLLLGIVSLFLPNGIFAVFGSVATTLAAIYLAVQAILVIDFGYSWNQWWFGYAQDQERELRPRARKAWLTAIIVSAILLFIASVTLCVYLYIVTPMPAARIIVLLAMLIALGLSCLSITDWCEHGSILTSCVMMLYTMWLAYETLAVLPDERGPACPTWVGLLICSVSLLSFAAGAGFTGSSSEADAPLADQERGSPAPGRGATELATGAAGAAGGAAEAGAQAHRTDEAAAEGRESSRGFAVQCLLHAAAAFYVAASLAPQAGGFMFGSHVAALFLALALYGWSLVAPKVLTGRNFN